MGTYALNNMAYHTLGAIQHATTTCVEMDSGHEHGLTSDVLDASLAAFTD